MADKTFHGKVLLYGEYTVIFGGHALAIPSKNRFGRWRPGNEVDERLTKLIDWLFEKDVDFLNLDQLHRDVESGYHFDSNIPLGYGLGSSGALTAALLYHYGSSTDSLETQLIQLQLIESYFHGSSSGMDPLVSFLNVPVLSKGQHFQPLSLLDGTITKSFFLLDSQQTRSTKDLVNKIKEKMASEHIRRVVTKDWLEISNAAVSAHLEGQAEDVFFQVKRMQKMIWEHLPELIPPRHVELWNSTLDHQDVALKLCGAGGGGMTLGMGRPPSDWEVEAII